MLLLSIRCSSSSLVRSPRAKLSRLDPGAEFLTAIEIPRRGPLLFFLDFTGEATCSHIACTIFRAWTKLRMLFLRANNKLIMRTLCKIIDILKAQEARLNSERPKISISKKLSTPSCFLLESLPQDLDSVRLELLAVALCHPPSMQPY